MYSDIIPPKKRFQRTRTEEYNEVRFSSPHRTYSYNPQKSKKTPIILFLAACVVVGIIVYTNFYHSTTFTITPEVARFQIKQKVPLILQGREKDSLTYSLVYVPATRNPFQTVSTTTATTPVNTSAPTAPSTLTITASTTGDTKKIIIINKTGDTVPLRKETRFDVDGVVYTLDMATQNAPTTKAVLNSVASSTATYRVIGFKGYPTYDSVYAVLDTDKKIATAPGTTTTTTVSTASSTIPPQDLLSLMPAGTLALQKSTIYDKLVDQSAVVVFDQNTLEEFLKTNISQTEEYYKVMKPFGESISYDIVIVDYTLETSPESGKPISFSSLILEIVPKIDVEALPLQFAGFSKDTISVIQKQVESYIQFDVAYRPFWTDSVASAEKIKVHIKEDK